MNIRSFYKKHNSWILFLIVGVGVFTLLQFIMVVGFLLQSNPLPAHELSNQGEIKSIDASLTAEVISEKANLRTPIVWSDSSGEIDLQQDLERGAIRYPGTPEPGNVGNSFITAHSSNFPWLPGEYNQAFSKLGRLDVGDDDLFVVYKKDGVPYRRLQFRVTHKEIVKPSDIRMIEQKDKTEMTLATCWPLGTNWRRLMVKTELVAQESLN